MPKSPRQRGFLLFPALLVQVVKCSKLNHCVFLSYQFVNQSPADFSLIFDFLPCLPASGLLSLREGVLVSEAVFFIGLASLSVGGCDCQKTALKIHQGGSFVKIRIAFPESL